MPRTVERLFPDAGQAGIATGVVLNQSRVTFSGGKGTVLLIWQATFTNAGAVAINSVGVALSGSALGGLLQSLTTAGWFDATVGRTFGALAIAVIKDPAPGSFLELKSFISGGTVSIAINAGSVLAVSFADDVAEGPTITVS